MSEDRDRINRIAAEQMLSGAWVGWGVGSDPLADLLAATAVSARDDELAGEEAAVMAFRGARLSPTPELRRRSMVKTALAKLATAKAAIALIALGGGGVALAAGSGNLPGVGASNDHAAGRPSTSVTASEHASGSAAAAHGSKSAEASNSAEPSGSGSGTPSPNLRGLCTAFNAGAGSNPGKALDNPAFTVLITAAGGKDKVPDYCTTVLAAAPGKSSAHPGEASSHGSPSTHPTGAPSTHPTGAPSTHPSGPPSIPSHPVPSPTH
jgi:hypothetical protein